MNEQEFPAGSVPVAVTARVYGKDASWVRAGIVSGWLPIGKATRNGKLVTTLANYKMAQYVEVMARQLNLEIPTPITVGYYITLLSRGGLNTKSQKYLIDELQMMLHQMNVEIATLSCDSVDVLQKDGFSPKVTFVDEVDK